MAALAALAALLRALNAAQAKSDRLAAARMRMPAGSRAAGRGGRLTTANARWSTAAEERDRRLAQLEDAAAREGYLVYGHYDVHTETTLWRLEVAS
jgi:hypothetical protein